MLVMVVLGVALRFVQEARADTAAAKLKAMISVTATVVRDGQAREIPLGELVPGDVVKLAAGDMIPADVRLISCKDLFLIQASLTGESLPVEKFDAREDAAGKLAAGAEERLLPGHQRGERHGHGGGRRHRLATPTWAAWPSAIVGQQVANQLRQGREPVHLADDPLHGCHGAAGLPHQRPDQARLEARPSSSPWPWPWG